MIIFTDQMDSPWNMGQNLHIRCHILIYAGLHILGLISCYEDPYLSV